MEVLSKGMGVGSRGSYRFDEALCVQMQWWYRLDAWQESNSPEV